MPKLLNNSFPDVYMSSFACLNDVRGSFSEILNLKRELDEEFPDGIRQVSQSTSSKKTIRGIHLQTGPVMGKAIRVLRGSIFLVNVDLRPLSETFGYWNSYFLHAEDNAFCYAPGYYGRAFYALEDDTVVEYFHSASYDPATSYTIAWNDPDIGVYWPNFYPTLSDPDKKGLSLADWKNHPSAQALNGYGSY
jgi:dTDP-4-dehydrorhamnose 3,5-epimerase